MFIKLECDYEDRVNLFCQGIFIVYKLRNCIDPAGRLTCDLV